MTGRIALASVSTLGAAVVVAGAFKQRPNLSLAGSLLQAIAALGILVFAHD